MDDGNLKPKIRMVEFHPIVHEGQQLILLRDPLNLREASIGIPRPLAPLLALMDGTRTEDELEAALRVRTGLRLAPSLLTKLVTDLDQACLLDNERFAKARGAAVESFRQAPSRPLSAVGGSGLFSDPDRAAEWLQVFVDALPPLEPRQSDNPVRGVISPHIDFQRGGPVYARAWREAESDAKQAELVVIFGTDHKGSDGSITLTRQSYTTPWGVLPTDQQVVSALANALGEEAAFSEELHHKDEHSIELAAIWLHFVREGLPVPLVPILCGSFASFIDGNKDPATYEPFSAMLEVLRTEISSRKTLVVAAADLAHMGPAFGDPYGLDFVAKAQARSADERLLNDLYAGNAEGFFAQLKDEGDRRNVCGLPPIYLTLRLLGRTEGQAAGYEQCPADSQGMSYVTIAGGILR